MAGDQEDRTITDADAEAIAEALRRVMVRQFYVDVGRGVWAFAWRGILLGLLAIAAYGAMKNTIH